MGWYLPALKDPSEVGTSSGGAHVGDASRHQVHASGELQRVLRKDGEERKVQRRHEEVVPEAPRDGALGGPLGVGLRGLDPWGVHVG